MEEGASSGTVAELLLSHCPADGLVTLLSSDAGQILRAAIVTLGLKGSLEHCPALVALLRRENPDVVQLAERSLWRIWMRAGSGWGTGQLARAIDLIKGDRYGEALEVLDGIIATDPTFAEPYHQRGIALCLLDRLEEAAEAFRQALARNPYHFSAAVSLGHVCAQQGRLPAALRYYRRALELHPRLEGVAELVERLETIAGRESRAG